MRRDHGSRLGAPDRQAGMLVPSDAPRGRGARSDMSHRVPGILMCLVALAPSACGDPVHSLWVSNQSANAYVVRASLDGQMRVVSVAPRVGGRTVRRNGQLPGGRGGSRRDVSGRCRRVVSPSVLSWSASCRTERFGGFTTSPSRRHPAFEGVDSLPTAECLTSATGGRPSSARPVR
jgi:hypothetical protein